jgi:hypothetical protein
MYKGQINCQQLMEQMKSTTELQQADLLCLEQEQDGAQAVQQELQFEREVCNFWSFVRRLFGT